MQRRPREVPIDRPSTMQTYIPKALLRDDAREQSSSQQQRWLPTGSKPDASKHSSNTQAKRSAMHKVEVIAYCSEPQAAQLHALEDEMEVLESEVRPKIIFSLDAHGAYYGREHMDKFVQEFYVAAATFSAHASAQKALVQALLNHE